MPLVGSIILWVEVKECTLVGTQSKGGFAQFRLCPSIMHTLLSAKYTRIWSSSFLHHPHDEGVIRTNFVQMCGGVEWPKPVPLQI